MADVVTKAKRSQMMAGIKGQNTQPELQVRKALFAKGFRYGLHNKNLPGKPDLVLPKYKSVIFVNGCYWHGHDQCHLFRPPKSNTSFWDTKIGINKKRDQKKRDLLMDAGWRVLVIWECALKGARGNIEEVTDFADKWLRADGPSYLSIRYKENWGVIAE